MAAKAMTWLGRFIVVILATAPLAISLVTLQSVREGRTIPVQNSYDIGALEERLKLIEANMLALHHRLVQLERGAHGR